MRGGALPHDGAGWHGADRPMRAALGTAVGELAWPRCLGFTLSWQAVTFAMLAAQLVLVCALGPLALVLGLVATIVLFIYRPLSGVIVFLQLLLYQNVFLSIFSPWGMEPAGFTVVQGTSFGAIAGMAAVSFARIRWSPGADPRVQRLAGWILVALLVIALYTAYGMLRAPPASALIYFRNTSAMLLTLVVGLDVGRSWNFRTLAGVFLFSLMVGLLMSAAEYAIPDAYYTAINARDYQHLRSTQPEMPEIARSVDEILSGRIVRWFNITGGATDWLSVRIFGPNMLAVSYAYVIACGGIAGLALGVPAIGALAIALLLVAGVKGPLLLLVLTCAIAALWHGTRSGRCVSIASAVLFAAYVGQGLRVGTASGDFHVIGFLGGVSGFLREPWGHGIGVGGNLSATAAETLDWQAFQQSGADFALESAVGVLIYQLGMAAVAVFGPLLMLVRTGFGGGRGATRAAGQPRPGDVVLIGVAVAMANGVFQEEAYSPYALGLLTLLAGAMIASSPARRSVTL